MQDRDKTKEQLIDELAALRQRVAELETSETELGPKEKEPAGGHLVQIQDITERKRAEEKLAREEAELRATLYGIGDAVIATDIEGRVARMNPAAERLTGWIEAEAAGQPLEDVFCIVNEETRHPAENPVARVLHEGAAVDLASHTLLIDRDGHEVPIADAAAPILDPQGNITGVVLVFRDQTEEHLTQRLTETRLSLIEYAASHTLEELLTQALDEVGTFVDSPIGFYHFVEPDQRTLSLQQWSTRTLEEFCRAEGKGVHYGIDQAGVWVDCVYERAPVIHNDYASLPHRKGIPEGHAEVIRELVVPVMRNDKVVAILGVGNKPTEYTQKDVGIVSYFADVTWEIVRRKRAEEALKESEEKLRLIFENAFDGISIHEELPGRSRRLLDCNDRYVEMSGRSKEELLEIQNTTLIQRTLGPFLSDEENLRIRRNRQTYHGIFSWIRPDGKENVIEYSAAPVSIGGRDLTIGVDRDITERKRVEEERERLLTQIREQIRQVQQIIDTVPEGVLLMDADGQVVLANPAAEIDLAVLGGAEVGDTITRLGNRSLPELLTSPPKGLWHEVASDDRVFEVIARPMENGPEPEDWVLVINDVTQEREIQRLIQQQERLAAVGQLAAGIAHDFNNIMASIVLYAQMTAQMEELPATVRERMETINHQAGHATRLIQQILDFSRRAVLERRPLDLGSLLKEHVRLLKRTLPESIKILLTYGPGEYVVRADPTRMQQMVTNLSLNARDAMPEGGTLCIGLERVEIKSGESSLLPEMKTGEWVQVTVSDTGAGIPPDALPHIFEPFFTTRAPLGSGLGLAQVHGIVGQHEGRIDVETQVGQGTTFTIYLPAHSPESSTLAAPQELSALFTGQREIILVVEDDVVVREALVESLEMLNYRVLEAASGQEALALLEQHGEEIMLVLSDVVMPGMGGIALLHALRERGLEIKVVMLTGHPMEREMEELQAQGMIDWLSKPASLRQLAGVLARALDRKTAGRS